LAEVYTSLQTHVVDGIVITLDGFEGAHLYEVQKYLSVLNPVWAGRYFLASSTIWKGLPPDVAALIQHNVTKFALDERARIDNSDTDYITKLTQQGMTVVRPQAAPFKAKCGPHYAWCKETFGDQAWNLLEQSTGRLG
jgi:TRAP-type C4-dicarboxylate transport system substrate-binding protein